MSMRYKGGILSATPPVTTTSYGSWTLRQQMQAKGASTWPAPPAAPTIGTATAGINNCGSVTFTAPVCKGYPATITGYRVISTPGCFTNTGASSPIVVSGLTNGSSYTFKVQATNSSGYGPLSAASNSITASVPSCQTYTTAGCYTWVAPSGVTSVAVLVVGGGGGGGGNAGGGGAGGALRYMNGYSVTPGNSYALRVGVAGTSRAGSSCGSGTAGGQSYFVSTGTVLANGGCGGGTNVGSGPCGATGSGGSGGGSGGKGGNAYYSGPYANGGGGGGAAGYSGNGGNGHSGGTQPTACGGGGGGGGAGSCYACHCGGGGFGRKGGYGGGVGLYGKGATGTTGNIGCSSNGFPGTPGSSGSAYFYGGGGAGAGDPSYGAGSSPGPGAVRIVWYSAARGTPSFPSTNVGP